MKSPPPGETTFEKALEELEDIVRKLDDGSQTLDASLAAYERGIGLIKHCTEVLKKADQRILELEGISPEGEPLTKPFEHSSAVESPMPRKRKP